MRYIIGIKDGIITTMPTECIFNENEEDLEMSVFREGNNSEPDIGTKEYLMNKYKGQLNVEDFDD